MKSVLVSAIKSDRLLLLKKIQTQTYPLLSPHRDPRQMVIYQASHSPRKGWGSLRHFVSLRPLHEYQPSEPALAFRTVGVVGKILYTNHPNPPNAFPRIYNRIIVDQHLFSNIDYLLLTNNWRKHSF